jgi:threonine dehydrogenase-like Zn-dependent dehydrogenase
MTDEYGLFQPRSEETPVQPYGLGYEEVAEVVEVGPGVTDFAVGDRVTAAYGHREEALLPVSHPYLHRLPPGPQLDRYIFLALGGVALDAYLSSEVRLGESAVIFGLGVIGQLLVQLCHWGGVRPIIAVDPLPDRRERALDCEANVVLDPASVDVGAEVRRILSDTRGADVVFETSGSHAALHEAIRCGAPGYSKLMAVAFYQGEATGLRLGEEFHHGGSLRGGGCVEIRINTHRAAPAPGRAWDLSRVLRTTFAMLRDGRLGVENLITHRFPFDQAPAAFAVVDQTPQDCLKVLLTFGE